MALQRPRLRAIIAQRASRAGGRRGSRREEASDRRPSGSRAAPADLTARR